MDVYKSKLVKKLMKQPEWKSIKSKLANPNKEIYYTHNGESNKRFECGEKYEVCLSGPSTKILNIGHIGTLASGATFYFRKQ